MSYAWVPSHATIFFLVPDKLSTEYLRVGSLGAGLNFENGIRTCIELSNDDVVYWNGTEITGEVSKHTLDLYREETNILSSVKILHKSDIPIGFGLSTSGAGAIGTALALDHYFESQIEQQKLFQIAHISDATMQTGLGSVMGQISSGIEFRTKIGGPGIGVTRSLSSIDEVVLVFFGPLSTSQILSSPIKMQKVNEAGQESLNSFLDGDIQTTKDLLDIGYQFAKHSGLLTETLTSFFSELASIPETSFSMAMIGETAIILPNDKERLRTWLSSKGYEYLETRITNQKPKIMPKTF